MRALLHTWRQYEQGRALHGAEQAPVPLLALRIAGCGILLDSAEGFVHAPAAQLHRAVQCARYMNGESGFSPAAARTLLRSIQRSEPTVRAKYWANMRALRRRQQVAVRDEPINVVFTEANEARFLACAALVHRLLGEFTARSWGFAEGYEYLSRQTSVLDLGSLQQQLDELLAMPVDLAVVEALFALLDRDGDGQVSYAEFKAGLLAVSSTSRSLDAASSYFHAEAMMAVVAGSESVPVLWSALSKISLQLALAAAAAPVADVPPLAAADAPLVVYAPVDGAAGLPLGCAAAAPSVLRVVNESRCADIGAMLDAHFCPPPRAVALVAAIPLDGHGRRLYVWQALPRDHYTPLGMLFTSDERPPPVDAIRTLPLSLTRPAERPLVKLRNTEPPIYVNAIGMLVVPTLSGTILNYELSSSADSPVTLQDAFVFASR